MGELVEVVRTMRKLGPASQSEIALRSGLSMDVVRSVVATLKRSGCAVSKSIGGGKYRVSLRSGLTVELTHAAYLSWRDDESRRSLPMMQPGSGDRRHDCEHYDDCVTVFAHAHSDAVDAHCPKACSSFERNTTEWKRTAHDAVARRPAW